MGYFVRAAKEASSLFQDVARTVRVAARPEAAWAALLDFPRVASWLPVVRDLREVEPLRRYTTVLEDRLGPFAMRADLQIDVAADASQRRLRVSGAGEDRQVASRISAALDLAVVPQGEGSDIVVSGRYEITGRIATLGAGAIRKKGEKVLEDFFANVSRELGAA
jgi:carbon monoxide dehydrogenase subunit G